MFLFAKIAFKLMHVAFLVWFRDFKEDKMLKEELRMRMGVHVQTEMRCF